MDILINSKRSSSDSDSNSNDDANLWLLLPEELMFYIFTLVPPHYLFNSARYVCKPWDAAISSSRFAELCERFHVRSKPGLYVQNRKSRRRSYFLEFKDGVNDQFERVDLATPPKMGHVIATCDGILLLWSTARQLFVANPVLKCWLRIPSFPVSRLSVSRQFDYHVSCHCTIACVPRTAKFKVFYVDVLKVSGIFWYVFYVLRVGIDNSWKEIARKEAPLISYLLSKPVCNGGKALYWITNREVIVMDVDKEIIVREYPLIGTMWTSKYLWMGDFLSCIVSGDSCLPYEIYILDPDSGIWNIYHEMGPFDYMAACGHSLNNTIVSFRLWINDQIIFRVSLDLYNSRKNIHFGYNVKTKQLTKIEDIAVGEFVAWLHTSSLVSLPTTPA
ncbi:uncharacterized protein LOC131618267 [Vicia villosa]|uniref:uncharacterized protein LOC131618267 n=1 Tax=Vicia villosa TaxID=3911 RepID=UPI00273BCD4E|nr:uncharacterized protein LOC131618267 [Vicia villosa]